MDKVNFADFLQDKSLQEVMKTVGAVEPDRGINVFMSYTDLFVILKVFTMYGVVDKEWLKQPHQSVTNCNE